MLKKAGIEYLVLIETYWNVNVGYLGYSTCKRTVLIETYWNVNKEISALILNNFFRINRNILECKYICVINFVHVETVLIETYWNVNAQQACLG